MIRITPHEMDIFAEYVSDICGISLEQKKAYLIETRLIKLLKELGCSSYSELYRKLKSDTSKILERKVVDAITTNETLFFRDSVPFELLRHKILPDIINRRRATTSNFSLIPIRIWSAACSTGQEVYSIAIVLKECLPDLRQFNIRLLGTDISDAALTQAYYGQYSSRQIERGLSRAQLHTYFDRVNDGWRIKDNIRAMATFRKFNLMGPFTGLGKFDIIFCRNVAIYFAPRNRQKLFNKIADILEPDGYLMVGASEALVHTCSRFEPRKYSVGTFYQLKK